MRIEKHKSSAEHGHDHGEGTGVTVTKEKQKTISNSIRIERMETEESFETALSSDEESVNIQSYSKNKRTK
jgi:hypothetical protein